ncbi:head fiber protein [Aeromonas phage vB_AspA_Tola]|nr:head fiber protein [Aeromonas phage vB_AspA_Tola]
MARSITGDAATSDNTKSVSLATLAIVTLAESVDVTHPINIYSMSGKEAGTVIAIKDGTEYYMAMAQGSAPADDWNKMAGSAVYVLPAATTSVLGGVRQTAAVADLGAQTVSGADVAALITSTNAALANIVAKVNAKLAGDRTSGQQV